MGTKYVLAALTSGLLLIALQAVSLHGCGSSGPGRVTLDPSTWDETHDCRITDTCDGGRR